MSHCSVASVSDCGAAALSVSMACSISARALDESCAFEVACPLTCASPGALTSCCCFYDEREQETARTRGEHRMREAA